MEVLTGDWIDKTRGNLVVAATVIAGMSVGMMVNPPGGVWQEDGKCTFGGCNRIAGTSVLEYQPSKRLFYLGMVVSNLVSFSASMGLILLVIIGFRLRNRLIMGILVMFMVVAVLCASAAFIFAVALVQHDDIFIQRVLIIFLGFWVVFPLAILLIQLVRGFLVAFKFIWGCCRPRTTLPLLPLVVS